MDETDVVKMIHGLPTILVPSFPAHELANLASGGSGTGHIDVWGVAERCVPVKFLTKIRITRTSILGCIYGVGDKEFPDLTEALLAYDQFTTALMRCSERMPRAVIDALTRDMHIKAATSERLHISQLEDTRQEIIETSKGVSEAVGRMIEYRSVLYDIKHRVESYRYGNPEQSLQDIESYVSDRIAKLERGQESA